MTTPVNGMNLPVPTTPSTLYNFTAHPSTTPFQVSADKHLLELAKSQPSSHGSEPIISHIAVGALTFYPRSPSTIVSSQQRDHDRAKPAQKILLVQRASTDSMPNLWEIPGGACDDEDESILHSVARELHEEAGLIPQQIGPVVELQPNRTRVRKIPLRDRVQRSQSAHSAEQEQQTNGEKDEEDESEEGVVEGYVFPVRSGKLVRKYNFIVELDGPITEGSNSSKGEGESIDKDGEKEETDIKVKLDPEEHQNYVWATEEDVRNSRCGDIALRFTSEEQLQVILNAFEIRRKMIEETTGGISRY